MPDDVVVTPPKKPSTSYKTQLVRLIAQNGTVLFHSPDNQPYATVKIAEHHETMHLGGRAFCDYLSREYYLARQKVVGGGDLKDAIRVLTASAKHRGPQHDVFIRLARVDDVIWLDLGRPQWDAIKVTASGWSVVATPEVKFRRSRGLLALPEPVRSTDSLTVMLKKLINIPDPMLLIAWLLGALRGRKPYPILDVNGEHGSAKTSAERYVRRLIDPNTADLRLPPKDPRDIMIAALNSHVLAYDNLSKIDDWFSDALCVLSTGGGFSTRELFSDLDETLFSAERPIMLNGITSVVTRPDLLDRTLMVTLDPIAEGQRRSEADLDAAFTEAHPAILAALLDAVVVALRNEATTKIACLPRMADFATWVVAAEPALDWQAGTFLSVYRQNQQQAVESVLDTDVVADAIRSLPFTAGAWTGQLKDLLALIPESKTKPQSPRGLRSALVRLAPALRQVGITMTFTRGNRRTVTICQEDAQPSLYQEPADDKHFADADTEASVASVWSVDTSEM
jgi:hypothetical protein